MRPLHDHIQYLKISTKRSGSTLSKGPATTTHTVGVIIKFFCLAKRKKNIFAHS